MGEDLHHGVVAFEPLARGREAVMLGRVQVGEISPVHDPRSIFPMCFRLDLPNVQTKAWTPARDADDARRLVLARLNDWLNAAGLRPIGGM